MHKNLYISRQILRLFVLTLISLSSITAKAQRFAPHLFEGSDLNQMKQWVDSTYQSMTTEQRLAQLIMPIIYPSSKEQTILQEEARIRKHAWGGILYQKGLIREQITMNRRLQDVAQTPMLIALDGEWGLYMRLKDAPRFPRNYGLGLNGDKQLIYNYAREVARQCRLMGIHINFAPDVDVNINPYNPVIGTRSFGDNPKVVAEMSLAYAQGLEDGGILSCAKHFPGHGDTNQDSHKTLPTVHASKQRINEVELKPFKAYINQGFGGVMTAHLNIPAYEQEAIPSSLSYKLCTELLQEKLGFQGLIFTDGLEMQGVLKGKIKRIGLHAILAGNDMLLGPHNPEQYLHELQEAYAQGELPPSLIEEKVKKILAYKWRLIIQNVGQKLSASQIKNKIWSEDCEDLQDKLWNKSLHFLKGDAQTFSDQGSKQSAIAYISIGRRYARPSFEPKRGKMFGKIFYFRWEDFKKRSLRFRKKFPTIYLNVFSKGKVSLKEINRLASRHQLNLIYYNSPFSLNKQALRRTKAKSIVLASEGAREAQDAVLRLIASTPKLKKKDTQPIDDNDDSDPTANMSLDAKKREEEISGKHIRVLDSLALDGIEQGAYPSCQVYVSLRGKVLHNQAYGHYTWKPSDQVVNLQSVYDLASITKALATTPALMLLVGDGKINIHKPLHYYLPKFRGSKVGYVRLKELLFHEAGLPSGLPFYVGLLEPNSPSAYWRKLLANIDDNPQNIFDSKYISRSYTADCSLPFARDIYISPRFKPIILKAIADIELKRRGKYKYSDLSFVLLQQVIETVTGESLDRFLKRRLYDPIGAKVCFRPLEKGISIDQVVPTQKDSLLRKQVIRGTVDDETAACLGGVSGNAGLFASASELAKVCQLILNKGSWKGKQLIPERVIEQFCTTKSKDSHRALGFDCPRPRIHNTAESMPANSIGHLGFTGTSFWIDRDNDLIYIFLSNRTFPSRKNKILLHENYRPRILQLVYDRVIDTK